MATAANRVSHDEILTEGAENVSDGMEFEIDLDKSEERTRGARGFTQPHTKNGLDSGSDPKISARETIKNGDSSRDHYDSKMSAIKKFNLGSGTRSDGVNGPPQSRAAHGSNE